MNEVGDITLVVEGPVTILSSTGSLGYKHTQNLTALQWVVNHNLNQPASGQAYNLAGLRLICDVVDVSLNTTIFNFLVPQTGYAIIS